jgi:KDO2-lipid IV(A) lauroyltransferase
VIGSLMAALKIRRETVMVNLDIVYKDNPKTEEEKQAIYKGCMINLVRQMVNYFRIPDMTDKFWRENVTFSNEEAIKAAYNKGKGVIIIAMHYGAWEVPGGKFGMSGYPASNIVKVLKNPVIDKVLIDARLSMNFGTIPHKNSMKRIIEGLARGEGIVMAVDQNMKRSVGVMAKWFGHPASTIRSCAYLARETGAAVVAGYGTQDTPDKIEINVMGEMPWVSDPDPDKELLINTQNYISALEKPIYDAPEGWLWLHRRWKVQPEGMPNPYKEPKAKS